jgi:hypothetical protein
MILSAGRNIWRRPRARRVALLIDAANYFGALREALLKARSSVFVIGWDLDSRTRRSAGCRSVFYPHGRGSIWPVGSQSLRSNKNFLRVYARRFIAAVCHALSGPLKGFMRCRDAILSHF